MQLLLEIEESRVPFVMELLSQLQGVKANKVAAPSEKTLLISEIQEAVENLNLVKQGKMKSKPLSELLNEV